MSQNFSGKVVLVTGGTSGIGEASVKLFAAAGAKVVFTGRREKLGEKISSDIKNTGGTGTFIVADHQKPVDCQSVIDRVLNEYSGIDILFNNAGIVTRGTAEDTSEEVWSSTFDLNVTAVWRMSKLAIPHMRTQGGGAIVNNASDWGLVGGKNGVAYCASKGAVVQMTRAMALDHAHENIRINAVCPGETYVHRWAEQKYHEREGLANMDVYLNNLAEGIPAKRVASADEIARAVLFLAGQDSSYITGTALAVDGGNTAR